MNTRLVGKKCLKVFHVTPSGRAVRVERQAAATAIKAPREKVELDFGLDLPSVVWTLHKARLLAEGSSPWSWRADPSCRRLYRHINLSEVERSRGADSRSWPKPP